MISYTLRFPVAVALVATMVAVGVIMLFALGHSQASTSLAGGETNGAIVVDCDASQGGIQSECTYLPGSSFNIQIHITQPPAGGYNSSSAKVRWTEGEVNYLPTASEADESLGFPNCTIAARINNTQDPINPDPSVLFSCTPFPAGLFTNTGAFLTFEFQCKSAPEALNPPAGLGPNQSLLRLVPRPGDPQQGTHFTDLFNAAIEPGPALTNATVSCGEAPPPPTTPTPVPGALVFAGSFEDIYDFTGDTTPDCGGGTLALTLTPDGTGIVSLVVTGFNVGGSLNDNVMDFDPPIAIASDGSFFSSDPLPPPLDAILSTLEGSFDFSVVPATVAGILTIALVADPSVVLCAADFTAEGPPPNTLGEPELTPSPTATPPPTATATPVSDVLEATATPVSQVLATAVSPSLPSTGAGALDAQRGAGAGLWAMIGVLLAAAAAGLALYGWRYARAR